MNAFLLKSVASWVGGFFENRAEMAKAKTAAKIENVNAHLSGYSDEFLLIVWSYPFISVFVPALRGHTFSAFESMGLLPDWYIGGFVAISFSVFGIDKIFKFKAAKGDK